jgi:GMP synthase (glutamine-hydrolysing)
MSRSRLLVVDPSVGYPETQGVAQVLHGWPGESRVLHPAIEGDGPREGDGYDHGGVVLLGSRASVHDELPWLESLGGWLAPIVEGRVALPLLGVCFGHQMIAHMAGARIGFRDPERSKLVGVEETRLAGGRLLPGEHELRVVVSHREEVQSVPDGYRVTARRPNSGHDGLEHVDLPIFTFQFHPEARQDFARSSGFDPELIDERLVADSQRLLGAFRNLVEAG